MGCPSTYLELRVALEQQHVHRRHLVHISMSFKLLSDLRPDSGHWHVEGVHVLDFWRLSMECGQ
jgi:hypothetical protein